MIEHNLKSFKSKAKQGTKNFRKTARFTARHATTYLPHLSPWHSAVCVMCRSKGRAAGRQAPRTLLPPSIRSTREKLSPPPIPRKVPLRHSHCKFAAGVQLQMISSLLVSPRREYYSRDASRPEGRVFEKGSWGTILSISDICHKTS